ncbi:hypothetical protein A9Q02_17865 [Candidatus Chloroploca asiatica]|uniref:CoF synthetase n=2 Tax=Candidatus Chloroploca asiatica TaxID=1506545 RepID=A0A2H3KIU0_9CHLR|nr:hypothetical protein A9Q02_17865 [Candidatus Chloroploca asiatica]
MRALSWREHLALLVQFALFSPAVARFPFLDQEIVKAYQLKRLQKLVTLAYDHTWFYHQKYAAAGMHPSDIQSFEAFKALPTVTKDELIAHGEAMIDRRIRRDRLIVSRSSGSSGKFVSVYLDSQNFITQALQVMRMLKEFYPAYQPTDRELLVYTSPYPVRSLGGFYRVYYVHNLCPAAEIFATMRRLRPAILAIYPSILRELVTLYGAQCATLGVKVIVTNSEHATQEERDYFAAVFGCPVFDEYSSEELASIAQQCVHKRYHLVQDCSYIELLHPDCDGPVAPGQLGELVGTCLINAAMPIIRYRQGDMAIAADHDACSCGKTAPVLAELSGRKNTAFKQANAPDIPSGRILDWSYDLVLKLALDVREFQIIQEELHSVRVRLVTGQHYQAERDNALVTQHFCQTFGHHFQVRVECVPSIARTRSGKHIPIQSLLGAASGAGEAAGSMTRGETTS